MIRGVIAHHIDDRSRRATRVVEVGEAVGEARPEVEQRRRGLAGDSAIAVGGAGRDPFEQAQDRADTRNGIERRDEMQFRGAGIGEAYFYAAIDQRLRQRLRAIHFAAHGF